MKKLLIALIIMGSFLSLAPVAKADFAVSIGYSNRDGYLYYGYPYGDRRAYHHPRRYEHYYPYNHGYYYRGYYYLPYNAVYDTTVINTYKVRPTEKILYSQERLGISDIIVLSKAGVNDDVIIQKIVKTGSVFNLRVEEVEALRKEGVSIRIVNFMLNTRK